jgi:hypothetical protein
MFGQYNSHIVRHFLPTVNAEIVAAAASTNIRCVIGDLSSIVGALFLAILLNTLIKNNRIRYVQQNLANSQTVSANKCGPVRGARRGDVEDIRETCLNGTLFGSLKKKCNQQVSKFDILFNFIIKQEKYFCQIQQYIEEKLD